MNKFKSRDEVLERDLNREIAWWDSKREEPGKLTLGNIKRGVTDEHMAEVLVERIIALLCGNFDLEEKKRILCACDLSAGSTWESYYYSGKPEPQTLHRPLPLDKLPGVFQSELVPYEWKRSTLLKSMDRERAYNREFGIPWIPTEFEGTDDDEPIAFRLIRSFCFYRPLDEDFNELLRKIRNQEANVPGSVSRVVDRYGNNAHIYAFCQYWETTEVNGSEYGEYWDYGIALANELTALGCDPNQENVFDIARRDIRYGSGYLNGELVTL